MPWLWPQFEVQPKQVTSERGGKKILVVIALEDWELEEIGANAIGKKRRVRTKIVMGHKTCQS